VLLEIKKIIPLTPELSLNSLLAIKTGYENEVITIGTLLTTISLAASIYMLKTG